MTGKCAISAGTTARVGNPVGLIYLLSEAATKWQAFWESRSEVLLICNINAGTYHAGDHIKNLKKGANDYLTVISATPGAETFQCPNTAAYIAADTDYIWFKTDGSQRNTSTAELIGYDLQHTPIRYDDDVPNTLRTVIILQSNVTGDIKNRLYKDCRLPIFWDGTWNDYGYSKSNRPLEEQSVWYPEPIPLAIVSATVETAAPSNLVITFAAALNNGVVPSTAVYAVLVNGVARGVTSVQVAGAVNTLVLASPIIFGDTISVSYTESGTDYLVTATGNRVASFSGQAVTNNVVIVPPAVLSDGNSTWWFDFTDLTKITKDSGTNEISQIVHKILSSIMFGGGATKYPIWSLAAGATFDGVNDWMRIIAALATPCTFYLVMRLNTWIYNKYLFTTNDSYQTGAVMAATTNSIKSFPNGYSPDKVVGLNTWFIARMVFKTGASTIQINTGTKSTGDYGAPRAIDRWIIGAGAAGTFGWAAISVKEIIARGIEDSDPDQTTIYNYLSSKYGI